MRFKDFNDDELYVLKRTMIESSVKIHLLGDYEESVMKLHDELANEILTELKRRKCNEKY